MAFTYTSCLLLFFLVMYLLCAFTQSETYRAGDDFGWSASGTVDYADWASGKNFEVGDELVFKYDHQFHNVMEVSSQDFESCNSNSPIFTYTTGNDTVTLKESGQHCFLCGSPGHCDAGQKLGIFVHDPNCTLGPSVVPLNHTSTAYTSSFLTFNWMVFIMLSTPLIVACIFV